MFNPLLDDDGDKGVDSPNGARPERPSLALDDRFPDWEPVKIPVAADGGIVPGTFVPPPSALEAATPEAFICLRGPCRHYFDIVAAFDAIRADGKPGRQNVRACAALPGVETELTDQTIYTCSHWEPIPLTSLIRRAASRARWRALSFITKTFTRS